jgi:hypothetical protein
MSCEGAPADLCKLIHREIRRFLPSTATILDDPADQATLDQRVMTSALSNFLLWLEVPTAGIVKQTWEEHKAKTREHQADLAEIRQFQTPCGNPRKSL